MTGAPRTRRSRKPISSSKKVISINISCARSQPPKLPFKSPPTPEKRRRSPAGICAARNAVSCGYDAEAKYVPIPAVTANSNVSGLACAVRATSSSPHCDSAAGSLYKLSPSESSALSRYPLTPCGAAAMYSSIRASSRASVCSADATSSGTCRAKSVSISTPFDASAYTAPAAAASTASVTSPAATLLRQPCRASAPTAGSISAAAPSATRNGASHGSRKRSASHSAAMTSAQHSAAQRYFASLSGIASPSPGLPYYILEARPRAPYVSYPSLPHPPENIRFNPGAGARI